MFSDVLVDSLLLQLGKEFSEGGSDCSSFVLGYIVSNEVNHCAKEEGLVGGGNVPIKRFIDLVDQTADFHEIDV